MDTHRSRFVALMKLAEMLPKYPGLMMLVGFLCGRLDRVHFVRAGMLPPDSEARVEITTPQARIWTGRWFRGWLGSAEVPDPVVLVSALSEREADVYLAVDFGPHLPPWYEAVLDPDAAPPMRPEDRLAELRQRVDHALDVYNECRRLLAEGAKERERELRFLLETARHEVEQLSREIERLKAELPAST